MSAGSDVVATSCCIVCAGAVSVIAQYWESSKTKSIKATRRKFLLIVAFCASLIVGDIWKFLEDCTSYIHKRKRYKMGKKKGRKGQHSEQQAPKPEGGAEVSPPGTQTPISGTSSRPTPVVEPETVQEPTWDTVPTRRERETFPEQRNQPSGRGGQSYRGTEPFRGQRGRGRGQGRGSAHRQESEGGEWSQRGRGRGRPSKAPPQRRDEGSWGGAKPFHQTGGATCHPQAPPPESGWGGAKPFHQRGGATRHPQAPPPESAWGGARPRQEEPARESSWGGARYRQDTPSTRGETNKEQVLLQSLSLSETERKFTHGVLGRQITVETNHVRLNLGSLTTVYRYDVSIEPQKKPKRMLRQGMEVFRRAYYPNNHPSYDGQKLLYSAKRLPLKDDAASGTVTIDTERDSQEFKVEVKLTGTLDLTPLHNLLQKKNMSQDEVFQCVEVVFRQAYVNTFLNVGRRFYTPSQNDLGCGAVLYLGGFQAAVQGDVPFMNVDVAHKAFTKTISLIDLIVEMFSTRNKPLTRNLENFRLLPFHRDQMNDYLRGLKVIYEIPKVPGSKKVYRVNELAASPRQEQFQNEGRLVTVLAYFQEKWQTKLKYPDLPTIWVGSRDKRICLPIEFCTLKDGQPLEGNRVLGTQTAKMINYSATSTSDRKLKIQDVMRKAGHNANPYIQEFGFSIGSEFEQLPARVLDPPVLKYKDGTVVPKNGTWWAKNFQNGATIQKWTILGFGVRQDQFKEKVCELGKMIQDFGKSSGMIFAKPDAPFEYINPDQNLLKSFFEKKKSHDLIIVVFPPRSDLYYTIKQIAEQHVGLLTQCVKTDTLFKLNETTVRNILLKINVKMNGTNHVLHNLGLITDEPCMVMGADVTHPGPQARTIPSVVAVTASHDRAASAYNISVSIQEPKTEIIQGLEGFTLEKLRRFGGEPKRIYFFRDGVSDGEFERVKESEVAAIKRACQIYCKGAQPKLTFIVVQKRHHTRFFPTDENSRGENDYKYYNVPVGTCVDTVITNPDPTAKDFYLLSHKSVKGVARPTKYRVLYDENDLSYDDVEVLAYYLCHLYTRCNRAVSYPAPTYFAHLAADRAKGYLFKKIVDLQNLDQSLVKIKETFNTKHPMFFS